jgi:hypothetical protein
LLLEAVNHVRRTRSNSTHRGQGRNAQVPNTLSRAPLQHLSSTTLTSWQVHLFTSLWRRLSRPRHHHFGSRNTSSAARSAAHRLHACLNLLNAHRSRRASTAAEGTSATGNRLRRQVSAVARSPHHSLSNIDPQIGPQTLPAGSPWFGWSLRVPNAGEQHLFAAFNAV